MKGTEQSPILDARAMRLFPTVVWRAEIRPDACRRINEAIVAKLAAPRCDAGRPPRPQAADGSRGTICTSCMSFAN